MDKPNHKVKQLGEWKTLSIGEARNTITNILRWHISACFKNNNFDSWRDDILEMEVTLDDNNTGTNYITSVRFDDPGDNDLITWVEDDGTNTETSVNAWTQGNSQVIKNWYIRLDWRWWKRWLRLFFWSGPL